MLLLFISGFLSAEGDPAAYLGFDLATLWNTCGVPTEVFPLRGDEPWQDDLVFRYGEDYSLFLFQNRVWQVRVRSQGTLAGVSIGEPVDSLEELLGEPFGETEDSLVFNLPDSGFPVRLRVLVKDGVVVDLYLYRADF